MTTLKTTSLIFNFEKSDFKKFSKCIKIAIFDIPQKMKPRAQNDYMKIHIWARNQTGNAYQLHNPTMKLLVAYLPSDKIDAILDDSGKKLNYKVLSNYHDTTTQHLWIKLLFADYFNIEDKFVSNNQFYLHVDSNKSKKGYQYAQVLKIDPKEHYQERKEGYFELFLNDTATRLKRVKFKDRNPRKMPFDFDETLSEELVFRQLKTNSLTTEDAWIYEENTSQDYRTQIKFHSISNIEKYEKSRSIKLLEFVTNFMIYLKEKGLFVEHKYLDLESISFKSDETKLNFKKFEINVLDYRFNKTEPIQKVIGSLSGTYTKEFNDKSQNISFFNKKKVKKNDNLLILMDYSKDDFEENGLLINEEIEDGYKVVKSQYPNHTSQGLCINKNSFSKKKNELGTDDFFNYDVFKNETIINTDILRNFKISLKQLYLKSLIKNNSDISTTIPNYEIIKDWIFLNCFTRNRVRYNFALFFQNGKLRIEDLDSKKSKEALKSKCGIDDFLDIGLLRTKYDKYAKWKTTDIKMILSKDFIWEIKEIPERVLYPDIHEVLFNRELVQDKNNFTLPEISNDFFTKKQIREYNRLLSTIIENQISYEDLVGSGRGKYRNEILNTLGLVKKTSTGKLRGNEKKYTECLCEIGNIDIRGKRAGKPFETHIGIWFNKEHLQYFVGKKDAYKYNQDKGFQIRKILVHKGVFDKDTFFPLLNVEFVRYKSYTVQPYPFNLINIFFNEKR